MLRSASRLAAGLRARWMTSASSRSCSSAQAPPPDVPYNQYKADDSSTLVEAPKEADVVIVGGGVAGCALLYQLAKQGVTNTVLVEKDQLTAGTTWHTAGLVWRLRPSDVEIEIISRSHEMMVGLEKETDVDPGWINNGGLFIASTKERMDEYKRLHTLGKVYGIESHVLGPEETKKLYPLMNVDDVYASLYSPRDGTIDPAGYCTALTRLATRSGAKLLQDCGVTGIKTYVDDFGTKRVKAVETERGTINTKVVVNCGGVWAPQLGAMAGVKVPLIAMRHAYIVTERIQGIQNMPNVRDHDASVYLKLQGDALQVGGYEQNPIFWEKVDPEFAFSLFELDWDVFGANIGGAINRVPVIETTGVKSTVCGPESFTADHKPLLGESPEVRGFYLNCGYNSSGMMLSGVSQELAKWIINGRPDLDLYGYDIRRFTEKLTNNHQWIRQRSHESYAKNYSILFPHDEPLASRNMRTDALHEVLSAAGCVYQERQGWERPGWFSSTGSEDGDVNPKPYDYYGNYGIAAHEDHEYAKLLTKDYTFDFPQHHEQIRAECLACRSSAAVFNMSYFGQAYLTGPDAAMAADYIFSNEVVRRPAGSVTYTCMLNHRGGTEADLTVAVMEPGEGKKPYAPKFDGHGFYLAMGGGSSQHSMSYIWDILQDKKWNCQLIDHTEDMGLVSLQGPNSRTILQSLTDADLSNEAFPFSTHKVIEVAGKKLRALRLSFVGELGWELHVQKQDAVHIHNALMQAGQQHGGVVNAGYRAIDSLSIEKGYRHWHADLRSDDTPLESNLAFTCKLQSDVDFLGRSALEEQKKNGLTKKIACFTLDDHIPLLGLEAIWRNDEVVGFLRRGEYAFALDKPIGYGYVVNKDGVNANFLKSGEYQLERMGEKYKANIHLKTPFDPKHKRLQGIYE